ncbi:MAG: O-antigen ligase family protein [Nannocystaceae bacterium]
MVSRLHRLPPRPRPRARLLLGLAIIGPPLAIGGVWPITVPVFAVVIAAALLVLRRRATAIRWPSAAGLGLLAAGATGLQVLPLPGLRATLAPRLHSWVELARQGLDATGWPSVSPTPADTGLELLRLLALTGLVLLCAQRSWRTTARLVVAASTAVAVIGLIQHGLHIDRIYGLYEAQHLATGREGTLLSTFVNPNHQSGLLLLGVFGTAGLALAHHREDGRLEPQLVLGAAMALQLAALVLSMSRAALLAGMVVGALAAGLAVASPRRGAGLPSGRSSVLGWVLVLTGIVAGLGTLGAGGELLGLVDGEPLDAATSLRLRMTAGSLSLLDLAPLTGIGRGAFGDVFGAFDPEPTHVWLTHLECAPLAMLVEWGVLGAALLIALPVWWLGALRAAGRHDDATARRIALLGLLALAIQGLADFSLEFLGVAAPACALAGALSPTGRSRPRPRMLRGPIAVLLGLSAISPWLLPSTWASLSSATTEDEPPTDAELAARPLHAALHRRQARAAAERGDWSSARVRALAAVRLQPGHADGWLLLSATARRLDDSRVEHRALQQALTRLHRPADEALVTHLVAHYDPDELSWLGPRGGAAWEHLERGLLVHAPRHALDLALARARREPSSPVPLRYLVEADLQLERPALALHHARLWRQLEPREAQAHLAVVRALESQDPARPLAVREALEHALATARLDDLRLRGLLEEQLLRSRLRNREPGDRAQLVRLALSLRTRPADDEVRRRRLALVDPLLRP